MSAETSLRRNCAKDYNDFKQTLIIFWFLHFIIYLFFSRIRRVDDIREKSVFSELIGGQRQEENPDAETEIEDETSIDTGLIGDDNEDDVEVICSTYMESRFKKAWFKKEPRFKKDCWYNRFFST